jgi:magnesium-transporting ATPase (P-type)
VTIVVFEGGAAIEITKPAFQVYRDIYSSSKFNAQYFLPLFHSNQIKSGDIIKLNGRNIVPADMILLCTSNYTDGNQCYIETANIDGETNLKVKQAPGQLSKLLVEGKDHERITESLFKGKLEVEQPNKNIHNFIGTLHLDALNDPIPLSTENIILRSSLFSNTDWAYGVAIYVGQETKVQMNIRSAPSKLSFIDKYTNSAIFLIFLVQVI